MREVLEEVSVEDSSLLRYYHVPAGEQIPVYGRSVLPPPSRSRMEAIHSSERLVTVTD
jgi:hypothetical protein